MRVTALRDVARCLNTELQPTTSPTRAARGCGEVQLVAVELLVMPLSRYWSGDFVSEAMRTAWSLGSPYIAVTPGGQILRREGETFGGAGADAVRRDLLKGMQAVFETVPGAEHGRRLWNEDSDASITGSSMTHEAYGALIDIASSVLDAPVPWFKKLMGVQGTISHLAHATYFLPVHFDRPYERGGWRMGSLPQLRRELQTLEVPTSLHEAHQAFVDAAAIAQKQRAPLIVDL